MFFQRNVNFTSFFLLLFLFASFYGRSDTPAEISLNRNSNTIIIFTTTRLHFNKAFLDLRSHVEVVESLHSFLHSKEILKKSIYTNQTVLKPAYHQVYNSNRAKV